MSIMKRRIISNDKNNQKEDDKEYEVSNEILQNVLNAAKNQKKKKKSIKLEQDVPKLNTKLPAVIRNCRLSEDKNYIILDLEVFETMEPIAASFVYKNDTMGINYLLKNIRKISCYNETGNLVEIIGHIVLIKITKNQNFFNLTVIRELEINEMDDYLLKLEDREDTSYYEEEADEQ